MNGLTPRVRNPSENERFQRMRDGIDVPDDDSSYATYPSYCTMRQVLDNWPLLNLSPPRTFDMCDTLRRLDYADIQQRDEADLLRHAELPFIVYNVPQVEAARRLWTDEYIAEQYGNGREKIEVTVSSTNDYLYFNPGVERPTGLLDDKYWDQPNPTHKEMVSYETFANMCLHPPGADEEHWYWNFQPSGGNTGPHNWVSKALPLFQSGVTSLFVPVPDSVSQVLKVRAGMAGVFLDAHFDTPRNFIAVVRGHRRYILNAPDQCDKLGLRRSGGSDRQTVYDFSSPDKPRREYHEVAPPEFYEARAIDVVLSAGDVLYVPAKWTHTPLSLDKNIQANTRSGVSASGILQVGVKCGFGGFSDTKKVLDDVAEVMSYREMLRSGEYELLPLPMPAGGKLMTGERPLLSSNGAMLDSDYDDTFGGRGPGAVNMDGVSSALVTRHAAAFAQPAAQVGSTATAVSTNPFSNPMWVVMAVVAGAALLGMGYSIGERLRSAKAVGRHTGPRVSVV